MRILAGRFKGQSIATSRKLPYRPTQTRIRKSIFDRLNPYRYETVLDLFAGSGIMGFEAASRGAREVTLVEKDKRSLDLLKENGKKFQGVDFQYIYRDAIRFLETENAFDLIFADPPYGRYALDGMVKTILDRLHNKGKFVLECAACQQPYTDASSVTFGDTRILIWTKE